MQLNSNHYSYNLHYSNSPKETSYSVQIQNTSSENEDNQKQNGEQTQMINGIELNPKQIQQLRELQSIDRNVKTHEAAHQAAGGGLAGVASFSYIRGPDNQMYAVAGEVPIRMQEGRTPEETIANARQIIAAAMAPADPSTQDYKVAANAFKMELEAKAQAIKLKAQEQEKNKQNNDKILEKTEIENSKEDTTNTDKNNNKESKNAIIKIYQQYPQNNATKLNIAS